MLFRCSKRTTLSDDDVSVPAVRLGQSEGLFGFGQPSKSKERPRSTERRVTETGSLGEDEVVLPKRLGRIIANERDGRETDAIFESVRVGH